MPTRDEKRRQDFDKARDEKAETGYPVTVDKKNDDMSDPVKGLPKARA